MRVLKHYLKVKSMEMVTNYLNRKSIPTRNGGMWIDSTVSNILSPETQEEKELPIVLIPSSPYFSVRAPIHGIRAEAEERIRRKPKKALESE